MDRFDADYFDGRTSRRHVVEVVVVAGRAVIRGAGIELEHAVGELQVRPRVGATPLRIGLPEGGELVTQAEGVEAMLAVPPQKGLAHRLERHLGAVVASLVGLGVVGWFAYQDGIPWAARVIAERIPPELEVDMAEQGMRVLDAQVFKPSALPAARQEELRAIFAKLAAAGKIPARLEFRDGNYIGANAFALPGGVVVATDQLVTLLENDDHIAAVLAHEVGHLEHRHGARHILQDSITALVAAAVMGDASSVVSLTATLPALVMHLKNSREFEREADQFAYGLMKRTGRSPRLLGEALAAMEKERSSSAEDCPVPLEPQPGDEPGKEKPAPRRSRAAELDYLSTHPATEERIRAAEEAAK